MFLLFPMYQREDKDLLLKTTNYNANANLTDFKVIVLNPYIVTLLPRESVTYSGKCFFSWFLLCFCVCLSLHCELIILSPMLLLRLILTAVQGRKGFYSTNFVRKKKLLIGVKAEDALLIPMQHYETFPETELSQVLLVGITN